MHLLLNRETCERLEAISRADGLDSKCATIRQLIDGEYERVMNLKPRERVDPGRRDLHQKLDLILDSADRQAASTVRFIINASTEKKGKSSK